MSFNDLPGSYSSKIEVFGFNQIINDELALLMIGKGYKGIVFDYSGVPKSYTDCCDRHKLLWAKEKRGLSSVSVAEEGLNLVFKWFARMMLRFELREKNALVIGSDGFVGKEMCRIAKGVGMDLLDYDVLDGRPDLYSRFLGMAEIIFVCTPELKEPLLGKKEFSQMKSNPLIVNVSGRKSLVDSQELFKSISSGRVLGYAADHEEFVEQPLGSLVRCVYQQHAGAKSVEALARRFVEKESNIKVLNTLIIKNS